MMNYLYGYLAVGTVVLLVILISHRIAEGPKTKSELIDALYPERKTLRYRILNNVGIPVLAGAAALIAWPIVPYMKFKEYLEKKNKAAREKEKKFSVKREDLLKKMTIEEIEKLERVHDPMGAVPDLPFGHINPGWLKFLASVEPDDSIWSFLSEWTSPRGRKELRGGYAIFRNNMVGHHFMTNKTTIEAN